ncbi:MAG: vanadium-dependent haloperoxidase [Algicola sp.]|nr:vanadium-dependent haloperoxidase [Algicola sp.]
MKKIFSTSALIGAALFGGTAMAQGSDPTYNAEHSAARNWNEVLLGAIRKDFARPTVHARNLFHSSALMYDAWAVYDGTADTFFAGNEVAGYTCELTAEQKTTIKANASDVAVARDQVISYGMYALLKSRFAISPGIATTMQNLTAMAEAYNVDTTFDSTDISSGSAAAFGNYLASCIMAFGDQDGSNQANDYANTFYEPVNDPLNPAEPGTPGMNDPDRWQPLALDIFIDQAGNETSIPPFLGAEWGKVIPFALQDTDLTLYERDGQQYYVYMDPGIPAMSQGDEALPEEYKWGHTLVALWSSHLDPSDGVMIDISPASIGNTTAVPEDIVGLRDFYNALEGGSTDQGRDMNPATSLPYEEQMVPRGDYTRVLAEFWADGPDSETPPGHWFTILNETVNDHADFEKKFEGSGDVLSDLEWDVKAYLTLAGAVHDSAVTAWGIKGWYDYVRPVSALRYMSSLGQSTDDTQANYDPMGMPLHEGKIEIVEAGDALAGENNEHVGKIKLFAWRGPDYIEIPQIDVAGVGWILAENWWPYQRPSFVTPPFAGYISGHSTFSRAAAEVLTLLTGSEYFPGGMGEFEAKQNEFLVFEEGPSMDIVLQWATYQDASDQTSLSRIWGGIHPPVDDAPGRRIGINLGQKAFALAKTYFDGSAIADPVPDPQPTPTYPLPVIKDSGSSLGGLMLSLCLLLAGLRVVGRKRVRA